MNAIKPKLEQKDVGYGGMRAIGDAIGKQILELQVTIDSLKAELTQLRESKKEDVAEIYKLKAKIKSMKSSGEPVAWMFVLDGCRNVTLDEDAADETRHNGTPLYTHPSKDLTDEEIEIECRKAWNLNDQYRLNLEEVIRFAHAILRKAQEK